MYYNVLNCVNKKIKNNSVKTKGEGKLPMLNLEKICVNIQLFP